MSKYLSVPEMVEAMLAGEKLINDNYEEAWYDARQANPWRRNSCFYTNVPMNEGWSVSKWRIKEDPPKPKKRLMTREEKLGFCAHHPGIVVRLEDGDAQLPGYWNFTGLGTYYWATISPDGEIGEWHAFEKDVTP